MITTIWPISVKPKLHTGSISSYNLDGYRYSRIKTVVSQIGEIRFLNTGLRPKVEKTKQELLQS